MNGGYFLQVEDVIITYKTADTWETKKRIDAKWVLHETKSRSSQSIKIGINLSIDKSIKIGKFDLIHIVCIDKSVEIDDTRV